MKTKMDFPSINERKPEGLREDGKAFRVLIVDDSMFVTKQIGQILTSEGFEVAATAADGLEGLEKYKELYPECRSGHHGYNHAQDGRCRPRSRRSSSSTRMRRWS